MSLVGFFSLFTENVIFFDLFSKNFKVKDKKKNHKGHPPCKNLTQRKCSKIIFEKFKKKKNLKKKNFENFFLG